MKALLARLLSVLIVCGFILSIMYFPAFYLLWGIYNRNIIKYLNIVAVFMLSLFIAFQFYSSFTLPNTQINWLAPTKNLLLIYGGLTVFSLLFSRIIVYLVTYRIKMHLATWSKRFFFILVTLFNFLLLLAPVLVMRYVLVLGGDNLVAIDMLTLEFPIVVWVVLVSYLFVKYSEDGLLEAMGNFVQYVRRETGQEKKQLLK